MHVTLEPPAIAPVPVLALLDPRRHTWRLLAVLALGASLATLAVRALGVSLWAASGAALALLLAVLVPKWRDDWRRYGLTAMLLSVALILHGLHVTEYLAQWIQLHVLSWHVLDSTGLLSGANPDLLHAIWGWGVLLLAIVLWARGVRGPWALALLLVLGLHAVDQAYTLVRYLQTVAELRALGAAAVASPYLTLPGLLGRDGWLATADITQGTSLSRLPALTTAPRLDVQFWWCVLELGLLLPAANSWLAGHPAQNA